MNWAINRRKPYGMPRWRWVLGNYWRKVLWLLGRHWKLRPGILTWALLMRRIRWQQQDAHLPWDFTLRCDPCVYCGKRFLFNDMTVEHVIPKSHGGADLSFNKVGCCANCNRLRGALPLLAFLVMRRHPQFKEWARATALRRPRNSREYRRMRVASGQHRVEAPFRVTVGELVRYQSLAERDARNRKATDIDLRH